MNLRAVVAGVLLASAAAPAFASLPSVHSLGRVEPTPSGIVNTKYRNGDDGTTAIPLSWGTCPDISLTEADTLSYNFRSTCNLSEAGAPLATISIFSGTLPGDCVVADLAGADGINDGITCTTPVAASATLVARATRNADVANSAPFQITVTAAGTDSTAPTIPLGLVGTDNADGTGTLSWDASSDPTVSGIATGVASYQVKLAGSPVATVTAPSANVQSALTERLVGADDGKAYAQTGASHTLTFGGDGLTNTADNLLEYGISVAGDFTATVKITAYTPSSGTSGSIGIMARTSTDANSMYAAARWRYSDDKCNLRYRSSVGGSAANGTFSSAYTLPAWIKLTRAGDVFSAYCSSDGNTWTLTSSFSFGLGATAIVGPFITGGVSVDGSPATGTAADFNIHQSAQPSYLYTGAGGSFTVNAYDGTNRSSDSATTVLTPTGGAAAALVTVPAATNTCGPANNQACTVCNTGGSCTFTPSQLATIISSAANATANGIGAGDSIELRADAAGGSTPWATRFICNAVSGTSGNPIWLAVRDGDRITVEQATNGATNGLMQFTDCDYWNVVGSRDGTSTGLVLANEAKQVPACLHFAETNGSCYINEKSLLITSSTGVGLIGMTINGAKGVPASVIDMNSDRVLFKYARIGAGSGSNASDGTGGPTACAPDASPCPDGIINTQTAEGTGDYSKGDSDSGEAMSICSQRTVLQDVTLHHSGHTPAQPCGPYQVWRKVTADMNWLDRTSYTMYTGNHSMVIKPVSAYGISGWNTTLWGPLIEDSIVINAGTEPEHKEWIESAQLEAKNLIFRQNYIVQRHASSGAWFGMHAVGLAFPACGVGKGGPWSDPYVFIGQNKFYNNTVWGGYYSYTSNTSGKYNVNGATSTSMNANECANLVMKNNLFQGVQVGRQAGKRDAGQAVSTKYTNIMAFTPVGSYSGWANNWKGAQIFGNVFGKHPNDPPSDTYYKFNFNTTGGGLLTLTDGTATGWTCSTGTWPANFCGNLNQALTWANGTTVPSVSTAYNVATDSTTVRSALTLHASSPYGIGDAWPMTYVATADTGSGTTLVLEDANWIYDGWDIDEYTWGGVHTEYPDCIAIGATVGATAASATVVGVATATDTNYTTNTVTLASGVTRVDGAPVWPAARNSNGTCGAVWDNRGAAQ